MHIYCYPFSTENVQKDARNKEGTFFTFGDSVSNGFYSSLISGPYFGLCSAVFNACRPVYHWVYDMTGYWGDGVTSPREPLPDGMDYDHERVVNDVKKVTLRIYGSFSQNLPVIPEKYFLV